MKLLVAGAVAVWFLAACDKAGTGNTCASTGGVVVDTKDNQVFDPASLQITQTQKVCWQNLGSVTHSMTSDNVATDSIDITLPPDFTFTKGFGTIQDFSYHCRFHVGMVGVVHVR